MNVTAFVPTYRRPRALVWSLTSVLLQRFASLHVDRARIIVLNNDRDREPVERAVADALAGCDRGPWEVTVVHRDPPMPPIENWYGGIREFAGPEDVVFLHGDDDMMLRGSAEVRARALVESGADLLLSEVAPLRLIYDGAEARSVWIDGTGQPPPAAPTRFRRPDFSELPRYGLAFIGAHTYRPTARFWEAYDRTYAQMKTLPLEGTQQVAMLPYFLPIDLARRDAVAVCDTPCCLRGMSTDEMVGVRFGATNWRPGVLYAASIELLERGGFGPRDELTPFVRQLHDELALWYLPTMSARETREMLGSLRRDGPWQFGPGDLPRLLQGASNVAKAVLGLQNIRSRLRGWGRRWELPALARVIAAPATAP